MITGSSALCSRRAGRASEAGDGGGGGGLRPAPITAPHLMSLITALSEGLSVIRSSPLKRRDKREGMGGVGVGLEASTGYPEKPSIRGYCWQTWEPEQEGAVPPPAALIPQWPPGEGCEQKGIRSKLGRVPKKGSSGSPPWVWVEDP